MLEGGKPQTAKESYPESAKQPAAAPKEAKPQAPKEAAKQPAAAAPKQAAKQPAAASAAEEAAAPKEAEPQAPEEAAEQPAAAAPKELAKQPAAAAATQEAAAPKEAEPQAPQEAAEQPAAAAPKEAAKQPAAAAAPEEAATPKEAKPQAPKEEAKNPLAAQKETKPQAPVEVAKEAKPQAPKEAAKEAKPQATNAAKEKARQQPAEEWLQAGVTIPGRGAYSEDSTSGGHSPTFSAAEIAQLADLELAAYKTGDRPPPNAGEWDVPRELWIAPVGRSWQSRKWRRTYREQYRTAEAKVAGGLVDEEGNRVNFYVTTDAAPAAYYYVEGTRRIAWETEELYGLEEWFREQEDAPEAEAKAKKGHAGDQPSRKKATQAEKGHAADQPSGKKATQAQKGHAGDKATQGSGGLTQKLWSAPETARRRRPTHLWANYWWVMSRTRTMWRSGRRSRTQLLTEYEGLGSGPRKQTPSKDSRPERRRGERCRQERRRGGRSSMA